MANTEPTKYTLTPDLYVNITAAKWFSISADVLRSVQGTFPSGATENQQFLDLGCGPGNITRNVLLPQCPPCRRLVAVDSSEEMLKYARERFPHPKIVYDTLDIVSGDLAEFVERYGLFDRVYALHLLNWLKDQEQALKNIANLMKPGGEALFTFNASSPQMRFRKKLAGMPRWSKYAKEFLYARVDLKKTMQVAVDRDVLLAPSRLRLMTMSNELSKRHRGDKLNLSKI